MLFDASWPFSFCECVDAYGFKDLLNDGVFYIPGGVCLGYRISRVNW